MHVTRLSLHTLHADQPFPPALGSVYSRLKYGSLQAADALGAELAGLLRREAADWLGQPFATSASAWKYVPTAAHALWRSLLRHLPANTPATRLRVFRHHLYDGEYETLQAGARHAVLAHFGLTFRPALVPGGRVLLVDDIRVTGTHEQALIDLCAAAGVAQVLCLYVAQVATADAAAPADATIEQRLNNALITNVDDLLALHQAEPCQLNARVAKRLLLWPGSDLPVLLHRLDDALLHRLYLAAQLDGYAQLPALAIPAAQLRAEVMRRGLLVPVGQGV